MLLALSTWCDVEAYLQQSKAIILPIGSMEQHGPTGLIGTDAICPEVIAAKAIQTRARKKKALKREEVAGFSLWEIVRERAMSAPGTAGGFSVDG